MVLVITNVRFLLSGESGKFLVLSLTKSGGDISISTE